MSATARSGPPQPRLVFRVGVVGHRPDRLREADLAILADCFRHLLGTARSVVEAFGREHHAGTQDGSQLFADAQPLIRVISPLAEGVDRLFADVALDLGCDLCCAMPFPQAEFERDFVAPDALEEGSLERFRGLLARAAGEQRLTRFELDGDRHDPRAAYRTCGEVVVNQADLLIVVWDGQRLRKGGGTEDTFDDARRAGVPIVWVDARAPHTWQIVDKAYQFHGEDAAVAAAQDQQSRLVDTIRRGLDVPDADGDDEPMALTIEDFYRERQRHVNVGILWRLLRDGIGGRAWPSSSLRVEDVETSAEAEWPRRQSSASEALIDRLRPYYAWPDRLAVFYSDAYRSGFIAAYLMAAAAVLMDLFPLALGWNIFKPEAHEGIFIIVELLLIAGIIGIVALGRHRAWHERWIDYRLGAELIRQLRLVAPLGGSRQFPQMAAHVSTYGHPGSTRMAWYVRAVERDLGLPSVRLDAAHVLACATDIAATIASQISYHRRAVDASRRIEHRLHRFGLLALGITAAAGVMHLVLALRHAEPAPAWANGSLVFLCGFLPALGAAVAGISNQGEFRRIAKRSDAMQQRFADLGARARVLIGRLTSPDAAGGNIPPSREASELAALTAQLMVGEVLDWRVVFIDQPLKPPS